MNNRLGISDLSSLLAQMSGKSDEHAGQFLREFIAVVNDGLFADRLVKINTIGTFKIKLVEKRESIDVNTKERILIPEHYKLSFVPDKDMSTVVNKPFDVFESIQIEEGADTSIFDDISKPESNIEDDDDDNDSYSDEIKEVAEGANNSKEEDIPLPADEDGEIIPEVIPSLPEEEELIPLPDDEEDIIPYLPEEELVPLSASQEEEEIIPYLPEEEELIPLSSGQEEEDIIPYLPEEEKELVPPSASQEEEEIIPDLSEDGELISFTDNKEDEFIPYLPEDEVEENEFIPDEEEEFIPDMEGENIITSNEEEVYKEEYPESYSETPEDLFPPYNEFEESTNEPFDDESTYNEYEYIKDNNELEEEDMEDFNGNRRKPDPVPYTSGSGRGSMTNNVAAVILAAVIVVLVIVLAFLLLKPTKHKGTNSLENAEIQLPPSPDGSSDDVGIGEFIDDNAYPEAITPAPRPIREKGDARYSRKSSSASSVPAARNVPQSSITTKKGDRLNLIALEYYGDKVFWVYIYLANQSKIKNPDAIPVGVTLTIPSSKSYDINAKSKMSVRKAYALQRDIIAYHKSAPSSSSSSSSQGGYDSYGSGGYGNGGDYGDFGNDNGGDYGDDSGDYGDGGSGEYGDDSSSYVEDDYDVLLAKPNTKSVKSNSKKSSATNKTPSKSTKVKASVNPKQQTRSTQTSSRNNSVGRYL